MKRELAKEKKNRIKNIAARLTQAFPEIHSPLHHRNPFELLVATILSAQSTDEHVNRVTPDFFRNYPEPDSLARASVREIGGSIHSIVLFRSKVEKLKKCARQLLEIHGEKVPATMEGLTKFAGVGRKTANVVLGQAFGIPGGGGRYPCHATVATPWSYEADGAKKYRERADGSFTQRAMESVLSSLDSSQAEGLLRKKTKM